MASFSAGQTSGNEQEATNLLKSQGIPNPSSGLVRYVAYGAQDYGFGEAQQYGLPIKQSDLIAEQQRLRQEAIKPALESLQASKPEVSRIYETRQGQLEAEKQPLQERYQTLIDELTRRETQETTRTSTALATEYGKRVIDLRSGIFEKTRGEALSDIERFYGGQQKETTLAREGDLRDLANQVTNLSVQKDTALRDVEQQIANLMAGAGNQAINDALEDARAAVNREFESRFDELDKKIKEKEAEGETDPYKRYATISEGETIFDLQTLQNIFKNPKTYKAGGEDED